MPWRNGGGTTRELARVDAPDGDFAWRLSMADVTDDGSFSSFPGVDRIIVLLTGAGIDLHTPDGVVALRPQWGAHRFPGEDEVYAALVDGPTTDLNLMWRRDLHTVSFAKVDAPCRIDAGESRLVVFVAAGTARLPGGEELGEGDAVERDGSLILAGDASLLVFRVA